MLPTIHEIIAQSSKNPVYVCKACTFRGNLEQAVEHVIKNQFDVVERTNHK